MAQLDSICKICLQQDLLLKTVQPKDETMTAIYDIIFKCASVQVCSLCEQELSRSYRFFSNLCNKASNELFQAHYKDGVVYIKSQNREVSSEIDSEEETFEDLDYSSSDNCSTDELKNDMDFGSALSNIDEVNDITSKRKVKDRTVEVSLNLEKSQVNYENYNGYDGVLQFDEDEKIDITDHELQFQKEEELSSSEENNDSFDVHVDVDVSENASPVISFPNVVIRRIICYPCDLCGKPFVDDSARQQHERENHYEATAISGEKPSSNFTSKDYLTEHRNSCTVGSKKRLKCKICNRNFATLSYLREHIRHHDNPTLRYTCDVCGAKFKIRNSFVYHMNAKHSIKPYPCNNCCRNFTSKNYLTEHRHNCTLVSKRPLKKHSTGKKLYKCEICDRTFISRYYLKQHRRLHNNPTRMYTCDICGEKFNFRSTFAIHSKRIHSMKTYTCVKCCQNFSSKDNLKEHRKSCTLASNQLTISENAAKEKYH